jgi:hypothetical protein
MSSTTQTWIRAELIATGSTAFGPQLMIPADGLEIHGAELVFHCQGEVVYVAQTTQLRSVTWAGKQPNPETTARKSRWPKHGVRWTDEERTELRTRLVAGETWTAISKAHGRSRSGVQQEAVKQGWVSPETYQVREGLGTEEAGAEEAGADLAAAATTPRGSAPPPVPAPAPAAASTPESPSAPPEAPAAAPESGTRLALGRYLLGRPSRTASPEPQAADAEQPAAFHHQAAAHTAPIAEEDDPHPAASPFLRTRQAIPAPRSRPELTAGPWHEA